MEPRACACPAHAASAEPISAPFEKSRESRPLILPSPRWRGVSTLGDRAWTAPRGMHTPLPAHTCHFPASRLLPHAACGLATVTVAPAGWWCGQLGRQPPPRPRGGNRSRVQCPGDPLARLTVGDPSKAPLLLPHPSLAGSSPVPGDRWILMCGCHSLSQTGCWSEGAPRTRGYIPMPHSSVGGGPRRPSPCLTRCPNLVPTLSRRSGPRRGPGKGVRSIGVTQPAGVQGGQSGCWGAGGAESGVTWPRDPSSACRPRPLRCPELRDACRVRLLLGGGNRRSPDPGPGPRR